MARRSIGPGWAPPRRDTANQSTRGGFGVTTRRLCSASGCVAAASSPHNGLVGQELLEVKGRFNGGAEKRMQQLHFSGFLLSL